MTGETVYGLRRPDSGSLWLDGEPLGSLTASKAAERGFGMVPKDRRWEGVVLSMSVADNINLSSLRKSSSHGVSQERPLPASRQRHGRRAQHQDAHARYDGPLPQRRQPTEDRHRALDVCRCAGLRPRRAGPWRGRRGQDCETYTLINEMAAAGSAVIIVGSDILELLGGLRSRAGHVPRQDRHGVGLLRDDP